MTCVDERRATNPSVTRGSEGTKAAMLGTCTQGKDPLKGSSPCTSKPANRSDRPTSCATAEHRCLARDGSFRHGDPRAARAIRSRTPHTSAGRVPDRPRAIDSSSTTSTEMSPELDPNHEEQVHQFFALCAPRRALEQMLRDTSQLLVTTDRLRGSRRCAGARSAHHPIRRA